MKKRQCIFFLFAIIISGSLFPCFSQESLNEQHDGKYEIGLGAGIIYDPGDYELSPGAHFHLIRKINSWLGAGLGYELTFGSHFHQCIGIMASLTPLEWLSFDIGPSLTLPNKTNSSPELGMHTEMALTFRIKKIHLGPMIDLGIGLNDLHIASGIHLGFDL